MYTDILQKITIILLVLLVAYSIYTSRNFWGYPTIHLQTPAEHVLYARTPIPVAGYTTDTQKLFINERRVFTDPEGFFQETLAPPEGYNIITITARDSHNNTTEIIRPITILPAQATTKD